MPKKKHDASVLNMMQAWSEATNLSVLQLFEYRYKTFLDKLYKWNFDMKHNKIIGRNLDI